MKTKIKILLLIVLIFGGLFGYARYIETSRLIVREYPVISKKLPNNFNGLKIIHFSDILFGRTTNIKTIKKVVKEINVLKPDIVIYTGNLYEGTLNITENDKKSIIKELKNINTTLGCLAISNSNDKNDYKEIMEEANFQVIDEVNKLIYLKSEIPIMITNNFEDIDENIFTIGLIAKPDDVDKLDNKNIDVLLSGYSLNGQIRIPFYGALFKDSGATKYTDDYYKLDNTLFYINNGLGTKKVSLRLLNPPSINLYRFSNY